MAGAIFLTVKIWDGQSKFLLQLQQLTLHVSTAHETPVLWLINPSVGSIDSNGPSLIGSYYWISATQSVCIAGVYPQAQP